MSGGCVSYSHVKTVQPQQKIIVEDDVRRPSGSDFTLNGVRYSGRYWRIIEVRAHKSGGFEVIVANQNNDIETEIVGGNDFLNLPAW